MRVMEQVRKWLENAKSSGSGMSISLFDNKWKALKNGLVEIPEEQRETIALYENGDIFFATGKLYTPFVQEARKYVINVLKKEATLREVPLEKVISHYDGVMNFNTEMHSEEYRRLAERIIRDAANSRAADIKIIRTPEKTVVRFIIAGQEITYGVEISSGDGNSVISCIFDALDPGAGHSAKTQNEFQGFSVSRKSDLTFPENILKLRCQKGFHETSHGIMDHLAIRIFYRGNDEVASLEDLGLDPLALAALQRARDSMKGATIIGGETGDGKSTTLISTIKRQYAENEGQISVVTVEDPVEYKLDEPGIVQIPIQSAGDAEKRSANYRAALMHFVRINPHVGMISEMRDAEAARQVLQFIETGHQVWTTIHINSVNSIPFRLIDMGIEPTEISKPDSLKLLVKQTLVPLLCRCSITGEDGYMYRNPAGCTVCKSAVKGAEAEKAWAGFQRMVAVAEFIEPDDNYLEKIRANDTIGARNHWLNHADKDGMGGIPLKEKLYYMVHFGAIDPNSAIKKGAQIPQARKNDIKIEPVYINWIENLMNKRKS